MDLSLTKENAKLTLRRRKMLILLWNWHKMTEPLKTSAQPERRSDFQTLSSLLRRYEMSPGFQADLEVDTLLALGLHDWLATPRGFLTMSLDAGIGLLEHVFPGSQYIIDNRGWPLGKARVKLFPPPIVAHSSEHLTGYGSTAPLALCAAILKAKIGPLPQEASP